MIIGIFFPSAEVGLSLSSCVFTVLMKGQCAGKFPACPAAGRTISPEPLLHPSPHSTSSQCHLHPQDGDRVVPL